MAVGKVPLGVDPGYLFPFLKKVKENYCSQSGTVQQHSFINSLKFHFLVLTYYLLEALLFQICKMEVKNN